MKRFQRIVVIADQGGYGQSVAMGICSYAQLEAHWELHWASARQAGGLQSLGMGLRHWKADGIIAQVSGPALQRLVCGAGIPAVNFSAARPAPIPAVLPDGQAAGYLAARHLLENGFGHFGFCALDADAYAQQCCGGFRRELAQAGFDADVFTDPSPTPPGHAHWSRQHRLLEQWLKTLPKPTALLCSSDLGAHQVALTCHRLGLHIPQQIAVVGVGNDPVICPTTSPALSSVDIDTQRIGFAAAQLLDRLLCGQEAIAGPIHIPPRGVVVRSSSDAIAVADPQVAAALRYIRDHAGEPINVKDLRQTCSLTRRALDLRFHKSLGRTISQEIKRVRIERAKELLERSHLSIRAVAQVAGFNSSRLFARLFRKVVGVLPSQFRQEIRSQGIH